MYEEEQVEVIEDDIPEREGFGRKIKRHWKNFVNDPVSGTKKIGLIMGALILGGVMEKHHNRKDKELLDEEMTFCKKEGNEAVKMSKREFLNGIGKTHSVDIRSIEKLYSYKEFKNKK